MSRSRRSGAAGRRAALLALARAAGARRAGARAGIRHRHAARRRRRSRPGTSTCAPTARACRRVAAASRRARTIYDAKCASLPRHVRRVQQLPADRRRRAASLGIATQPMRTHRQQAQLRARRCGTTSAARCRSTRRKSLTRRRGLRADRVRAQPGRHRAAPTSRCRTSDIAGCSCGCRTATASRPRTG